MLRSAFLRKLSAITGTAIIAPSAFITRENTKFINSDSLKEPAKQLPRNYSRKFSASQLDAERKINSLQVREFSKKVDNMSLAGFHYTHLPQVSMDSCNN